MDMEDLLTRLLHGFIGGILAGLIALAVAFWIVGDINWWYIGIICAVGFALCAFLKDRAFGWLGWLTELLGWLWI